MININSNHKISLVKEDNYFTLYTYESLIIRPREFKSYILPYNIKKGDKYRFGNFVYFEVDKLLALKGVEVVSNNLNESTSEVSLEFNLFNRNNPQNQDNLSQVLGDSNTIRLTPEIKFGRIYF